MPIPRKEVIKFFRKNNLRHGGLLANPSVDSDYKFIDIFSDELPIYTKQEFDIAESIARKYNLKLSFQDFSPGEGIGKGAEPYYEPVFIATCTSPDELRCAYEKIINATKELQNKLKTIHRGNFA
jgi:hypothetical protein